MSHAAPTEGLESKGPRSPWREAWRRLQKKPSALVYLGVIVVFLGIALTAQTLEFFLGDEIYDSTLELMDGETAVEQQEPSLVGFPSRLCGTDHFGRSVFWRVFHGTKVSIYVGLIGATIAVLIGVTLGALAGFFGGWIDEIVVYLYSTLSSIPYLLLMLSLAFVFKQGPFQEWYDGTFLAEWFSLGLFTLFLVIGFTFWVTLCRLIRAEVLKHREFEYVAAATALGGSRLRVLFRHVLPNVFHLVIINFSLTFVIAIKSEVILSFLGLGVDVEPSWGQIIARAKLELLKGVWWPCLFAGAAMFILVLAVNYVGDALRDALDPRLKD